MIIKNNKKIGVLPDKFNRIYQHLAAVHCLDRRPQDVSCLQLSHHPKRPLHLLFCSHAIFIDTAAQHIKQQYMAIQRAADHILHPSQRRSIQEQTVQFSLNLLSF